MQQELTSRRVLWNRGMLMLGAALMVVIILGTLTVARAAAEPFIPTVRSVVPSDSQPLSRTFIDEAGFVPMTSDYVVFDEDYLPLPTAPGTSQAAGPKTFAAFRAQAGKYVDPALGDEKPPTVALPTSRHFRDELAGAGQSDATTIMSAMSEAIQWPNRGKPQ